MAVVVVTGANRGIGLATATALGRAGHRVVAAMRDPGASEEIDRICRQERLDIHVAALDVDDDASVARAFEEIYTRHGRVDALVNNAGISGVGAIEELPLAAFEKVMNTNYFGALRCIKAVLPGMREQRSGCIVNLSSLSGVIAMAPQAPYAASKFALEALSECLAQEVRAFNIRVALIEPGVVDTAIAGSGARAAPADSLYPQARRLLAIFQALGAAPTAPAVVAGRIVDIVEGREDRLRHPVGADAEQFLRFRREKRDEDIIALVGGDDEGFTAAFAREFSIDIRL